MDREGVVLDPPRRELQEFMVEQREAGMLLTMASKNNEQDVLDTFAAHPEMPLQLRHFTAWRLNWQSKAENLVSLADELGLGLDSFIFIDDNPKECAELSGELPEVLTLALARRYRAYPGVPRTCLGVRSSGSHRGRPQSKRLLLRSSRSSEPKFGVPQASKNSWPALNLRSCHSASGSARSSRAPRS